MLKTNVQIINKLGLHARAAAKFVTLASKFSCEVHLTKNQQSVNGKSIMGVMMLAAGNGSILKFTVDGEEATTLLDEMEALFNRNFEE